MGAAKKAKKKNWVPEALGWLLLPLIALPVFSTTNVLAGILFGAVIALLGVSVLSVSNVRKRIGVTRGILAVCIGGLILLFCSQEFMLQNRLETLKNTDHEEYLSLLRERRSDDVWLAELQRINPRAYQTEMSQREAARQAQAIADEEERLRREAEVRSMLEVQRQEREARERTDYIAALDDNITELESIASPDYSSFADIKLMLDLFDGFGEFYSRGGRIQLSDEQAADRARFGQLLSALQRREFPRMRDAYGPIQRRANWANLFDRQVNLITTGASFKTIRFEGNYYLVAQRARQDFEAVAPDLQQMRFERATFRAVVNGEGWTWNLPAIPPDDAVGYWRRGSSGLGVFHASVLEN